MAITDSRPYPIGARIDAMPFSAWHLRLMGLLGGAHAFDAFDATALAFVLPVLVTLWRLTPAQTGILISASYAGQFLGAVGVGFLAERAGRLRSLQFSLALMAVASVACAFSPGYGVLLLLRLVQGVGLGGETPVGATYMNEVCPAPFRGRMITAIQLMFASGALISSVLALLLIPRFGWTSMFLLGGAPILLAALLRKVIPESPRWLASRGKNEEAEHALARIERAVFGAKAARPPIILHPDQTSPTTVGSRATLGALLTPSLMKATLSAWLIAFCASIAGYGIINWMPTIYRSVYRLPLKTALRYSITSGVTGLLGGLLCIVLVDRLGRKSSLTLGFAGAAASIGLMALLSSAALDPVWIMVLAAASLGFLSIPLSGIYVYAPELYPVHIRALGVGVASSWLRIASILGPVIIGFLLTFGAIQTVYLFLSLTAAFGAVGIQLLGVETKPRVRRP